MFRILILIITSTLAFGSYANIEFVGEDKSNATKVCVSSVTDKHLRFRGKIKYYGFTYQQAANFIFCNNMPIAEFAQYYQAERNSSFLNRHSKSPTSITEFALQPTIDSKVFVSAELNHTAN
ncbi:DUF3718 domain-containing protein [Thalassomonas sp. M1454]|uniref:DUF3718 domain-containing protein n=1 Tax=Thalassomonas sp. M1454 TaxID=2594477 RepID=UPI00118172C8|nr:DUF3718 domain-containing protein [Thalassomonas sp. M1454]TRX53429.1 DUF3718 domain-containing protein [Thalassomonas sp. M1454]